MDALGARLATVSGLKCYDFPPASAQPPFGFVNMPESLDFDLTYARSSDRMSIEVYVAVGTQLDRQTRDKVSALVPLVKAALEAPVPMEVEAFQSIRVQSVEFRYVQLASGSYPGAVFTLDVVL